MSTSCAVCIVFESTILLQQKSRTVQNVSSGFAESRYFVLYELKSISLVDGTW